jgi:imidazolonepropionase-like amidohydrolase
MKRVLKFIGKTLLVLMVLAIFILIIGVNIPIKNFNQSSKNISKLYLKNCNIVDIKNNKILENQNITVQNGRVVKIDGIEENPLGYQIIDAKNKYVIPTLWDMHVHTLSLSPQLHFPLLIANGITNIRDMGDGESWISDIDATFEKDKYIWEKNQTLLRPNIWESCSYHVEEISNEKEKITELVTKLKARKEPFIKVQLEDNELPKETFYFLQKEAKRQNINILGHLSYNVDIDTALKNGYRSIEHAWALIPHFVKQKKRFEKELEIKSYELANQDSLLTVSILRKIVESQTFYVPTHVSSNRKEIMVFDKNFTQNPDNQYVESVQLWLWELWANLHTSGYDKPEQQEILKKYYEKGLKITGLAHKNGVQLLAGTDALDRYSYHGISLHDELKEMTKAGLSNAEALKTATINPAIYYNETSDYGSIEVGKMADFLVLNKNPLEYIENTQSIENVYFNQKFYVKSDLEEMKKYVHEQAKSFSINCKFIWNMIKGIFHL